LRVIHFSAERAAYYAAEIADCTRNEHVYAVLVDSSTATAAGGTGKIFDWKAAHKTIFQNAGTQQRLVAAGGLNPANVAEAIATLRPWGVDAVSGIEAAPGRKDAAKVREFIHCGRTATAV
jgi:phosphoribosylanthranilate isomerase